MTPRTPTLRIKRSRDGQFYFVVVAVNGQTLVTSETYRSASGARWAASRLIEIAASVRIVDETVSRGTHRRRSEGAR